MNRTTAMQRIDGAADASAIERTAEIDSARLFAGHKEVIIRHNNQLYRLIRTRNGKLILNK